MFEKLTNWFNRSKCYVIADSRDNSLTFSRQLCREIDVFNLDDNRVMVFSLKGEGPKRYGFMVNPELEQETQVNLIQYNSKYKSIGIESLCPTVNRIFYDYGIPANTKCRLSVRQQYCGDGKSFFEILRFRE